MNPLFEPDPRPEVEASRQEYLRLQAEADKALEAGNEIGTPEGDRAYEAEHAAEAGWERYLDAWHGPAPEPEAEAEPEAGL